MHVINNGGMLIYTVQKNDIGNLRQTKTKRDGVKAQLGKVVPTMKQSTFWFEFCNIFVYATILLSRVTYKRREKVQKYKKEKKNAQKTEVLHLSPD